MLLEAGLTQDQDYVRKSRGAHDVVAAAVAARQVTAGGISLPIFRRLLAEGRVDPSQVRLLAESPPIPEYMWTFREGLSEGLRESLREVFLELRDAATLLAYRADAFIPTVDADVDRVRNWMERLLQARIRPAGPGAMASGLARGVKS